jgi:predicted ribosome quality control (RQC) complex YloA/Tae2 family protein
MQNGFRIWVGKNAAGNDELTLKYSFKEDLWLHVKDVAGSHVIIKYQAGKKFPKDVIERAAQLAAYNSKRKNETLCPVVVTPKKFVRKRKGDPPGAVIVEREEVIMVVPAK